MSWRRIQLADFLIGAVAYSNRKDIPKNNKAKNAILKQIKFDNKINLTCSTPPWEDKFNLFIFTPRRPDYV